MEHTVSATELARNLGDILGRVRFRNDEFVIERNGEAVARIVPVTGGSATSVGEAFRAWLAAGDPEPAFANDLEQVGASDVPPADPWDS